MVAVPTGRLPVLLQFDPTPASHGKEREARVSVFGLATDSAQGREGLGF